MRLFIAINFGEEVKNRLLALCDELRSLSQRGNFSLPENLHLTLAFLGECDAKQAAAVKSVVDSTDFEPFDVSIDRIGFFRRDGGDTWWAGVRENKPLMDLQRKLTDKLTVAGFEVEKRRYFPHITLGREIITKAQPLK